MFTNEELKLIDLLEIVKKFPEKVLTNQHFSKEQWVRFNPNEGCFEYEDGTFLGKTPEDVIRVFYSLSLRYSGIWLYSAKWFIKEI